MENGRTEAGITFPSQPLPRRRRSCWALQHKLRHKEIARDSRQMTVEQAMEAYISSKSSILSPASLRTYRMYLRRHYQLIRARRLGSLTQADIQSAVNEIAATCSPKTTASMYGFLRAVLREYHPTFTPKPVLPGKRKKLQPVYTTAQIAALLDAARDTSVEIPVLLAVWLGMRRSEILGLRWDHVVLDGPQPHLVIDRGQRPGRERHGGQPHQDLQFHPGPAPVALPSGAPSGSAPGRGAGGPHPLGRIHPGAALQAGGTGDALSQSACTSCGIPTPR